MNESEFRGKPASPELSALYHEQKSMPVIPIVKLLIGIVSNRNPSYGFITSLNQMVSHLRSRGLGQSINLVSIETRIESSCSLLSQGRQNIMQAALARDVSSASSYSFTHLLMLDDDMTFPPDTCSKLFAHMSKGIDAIGVNATRRQNAKMIEYTAVDGNGNTISSLGKTGIHSVQSCGLSVFLINLDAVRQFMRVPSADYQAQAHTHTQASAPLFEVVWSPAHGKYQGEDRYFCKKLSSQGIEIFIDHDLSHEIGHIGEFVYSYQSCGAMK